MTNPTAATSSASRKIRWLGIVVIGVMILYSAGWFFLASKIDSALKAFLAGQAPVSTAHLSCDKLDVGGFPFLIGFTCDKTAAVDAASASTASAGALKVGARIYDPFTAIVELDGPLDLALADRLRAEAAWKNLRASIGAGLKGLNSVSVEGDDLSARLEAFGIPAPILAKASEGESHFRRRNHDLDFALMARSLSLSTDTGIALAPPLSVSVEGELDNQAELMDGKRPQSKVMSGTIASLKIETEDGVFGELSGDFEVDSEGYLSGRFKTKLDNVDGWSEKLSRIFPDARDTIAGTAALLKGLAKSKNDVKVTIEVRHGRIYLSLLPIGHIPPI